MGRWGAFLYYPSDRSPLELYPELSADRMAGCVSGWTAWDFGRELPEHFAQTIAATFGVPLLAAEIWDSDAAMLTFCGRGRERAWSTPVHRDMYADYVAGPGQAPFYEDGRPMSEQDEAELEAQHDRKVESAREWVAKTFPIGEETGGRAVEWANSTGLTPHSVERVTAALGGDNVFVEETVWEIAAALGIRTEHE